MHNTKAAWFEPALIPWGTSSMFWQHKLYRKASEGWVEVCKQIQFQLTRLVVFPDSGLPAAMPSSNASILETSAKQAFEGNLRDLRCNVRK